MAAMPRQHRGDRDQLTARPPKEVGEIIRERARVRGVHVTDYVSGVLAEHVGRPDLDPTTAQKHTDEELPLTG